MSAQGRRNDIYLRLISEQRSVNISTTAHDRRLLSSAVIDSSDSVHCNPLTQSCTVSSGWSCHTTANYSKTEDVVPLVCPNVMNPHPSWVHVFAKSSTTTSLRTQCASAASKYATSPKVFHRRSRRARKKCMKMNKILREVMVPHNQFKLSHNEIDADIIVFDGGNSTSPPIKPPDDVIWRSISVNDLHVEDDTRLNIGLTYCKVIDIRPFIRMPRQMSLDIIAEVGLQKITNSLQQCEKLRRTALGRGDSKRVFTDYGKTLTYACVGPQPSRNSRTVSTQPPFTDSLPEADWRSLVWMITRAEMSFRAIADHSVLSHLDLAKRVVPFKTFTSSRKDLPSNFHARYFGGIAFGTNVFLRCHTDADFTFSIIQVFLKGKSQYLPDDDVVVYFCFPTLGVAIPLRPGDYLLFNARIPHCISSRCKYEDEILCTSMYLKTAIVGMNNNDLPLTQEQTTIVDKMRSKT